jgi:hypothetical protein
MSIVVCLLLMYNEIFPYLKVLDEEAEVFVVKMWRLLIYETEAKKLGLVNVK